MHYYKRNLGDYAKKAGRLSMLQHGAYTLLIDACYDREQFPTIEEAIDWAWASSAAEIEAVEFVLRKFFVLEDGRYVQKRIQEEVDAYHAVAETNARIARERETKRAEKSTKRARGVNEAPRKEHEAPPNQEPLTNNQEPTEAKARARSAPLDLPDWLPADAWSDWHAYRNARKGWTAHAKALSLKTLSDLWEAGHDPRSVINQAIERGWTGLFPLRADARADPVLNRKPSASADFRGKVYESTPDDQMPAGLR